jgi:hypothetical protein
LVYVIVGVAAGAVARFTRSSRSSLAGMLGTGGAGGAAGGVLANLLFDERISLDLIGVAGAAILALVAVLVIRISDEREGRIPTEDGP